MLVLPQAIETKWHPSNKAHYVNLGFKFTKMKDILIVDISHLTKQSHALIKVQCDYCETVYEKEYCAYITQSNNIIDKDCCKSCNYLKIQESNLKKYNVINVFQLESVKEKNKQIFLDNYGVDHYSKTKEYKEKIIKTSMERWGVPSVLQLEEVINKRKQTNLDKYGVDCVLKSADIQEKRKRTLIAKYGVEHYSQTDEFKEKYKLTSLNRFGSTNIFLTVDFRKKRVDTLYKNGNVPTSSQQLKVYEMLLQQNYNVKLNYPLSRINLDIALFINEDIKIDLEYDGWYWHQDPHRDRKRDEFTKSKGWKVLRIRSGNKIPSLEQLQESITKLITTDQKFTAITLEDWKVKDVI